MNKTIEKAIAEGKSQRRKTCERLIVRWKLEINWEEMMKTGWEGIGGKVGK